MSDAGMSYPEASDGSPMFSGDVFEEGPRVGSSFDLVYFGG